MTEMDQKSPDSKQITELEQERAKARQDYLHALDAVTSSRNKQLQSQVLIVLRDSDATVSADHLVAFAADSSQCVVSNLHTSLGLVPAAVIQSCDIACLRVKSNTTNPDEEK